MSTAATKESRTKTSYQLLRLVEFADPEDGAVTSGYMEVGTPREAANPEALLRTVISAGTYVAVPARSWKPVKVTVETQTVVKFD